MDLAAKAPIAIALGAILGALSRYYCGGWLVTLSAEVLPMGILPMGILPIGTFIVNLSGCGLMGIFTALNAQQFGLSREVKLLVATGFLGAYTTFSAYALDLIALLEDEQWLTALGYGVGSPGIGLICFYGGTGLGQRLRLPKSR